MAPEISGFFNTLPLFPDRLLSSIVWFLFLGKKKVDGIHWLNRTYNVWRIYIRYLFESDFLSRIILWPNRGSEGRPFLSVFLLSVSKISRPTILSLSQNVKVRAEPFGPEFRGHRHEYLQTPVSNLICRHRRRHRQG